MYLPFCCIYFHNEVYIFVYVTAKTKVKLSSTRLCTNLNLKYEIDKRNKRNKHLNQKEMFK